MAGPASNYAKVLALPGIKELIAAKVRYLVVVGGAFGGGPADPNIKADIAAAKKLFAEWPGPIVAVGAEMAQAALYPASSIEKDFAYTEAHPVVDAYRAYKAMPYDATTWDLAAVLYAVRPNENYFKLSAPGVIKVGDDGRTQFTPSADGTHRYLIADPAQKDKLLKTYIELVSAKPVPRAPRFRRPVQQKKDDAKKPDDAKPVTPPRN